MSQTLLENVNSQPTQANMDTVPQQTALDFTELPNPVYDETVRDMDHTEATKSIERGRAQAFEDAYRKDDTDFADDKAFDAFMNAGFTESNKVSIDGADVVSTAEKPLFGVEANVNVPPVVDAVGNLAVDAEVEKEEAA